MCRLSFTSRRNSAAGAWYAYMYTNWTQYTTRRFLAIKSKVYQKLFARGTIIIRYRAGRISYIYARIQDRGNITINAKRLIGFWLLLNSITHFGFHWTPCIGSTRQNFSNILYNHIILYLCLKYQYPHPLYIEILMSFRLCVVYGGALMF